MIPKSALIAMICREGHPFAWVEREDGVVYVEIPRFNAREENGWIGTPRRTELKRGSLHRAGCACGMWLLVSHEELEDGVSAGRRRIVR